MALFDRYIAVDWSAANTPRTGKDSIWIADSEAASANPATRHEAMATLTDRLISARAAGQRVMLGFDFVFGYPQGAAEVIIGAFSELSANPTATAPLAGEVAKLGAVAPGEAGRGVFADASCSPPAHPHPSSANALARPSSATLPARGRVGRPTPADASSTSAPAPWCALWSLLHALVVDGPDNSSNRFHVAAAINARLAAPHYWGHPHQHRYDNLEPRRPLGYVAIPERRRAEMAARSAQPVWKLTGAGAVGSQSLLGIARLEALRRHPVLGADIAVWPFDTAFAGDFSRPIAIVEIYPSLFELDDPSVTPKDRGQVETCVRRFAAMDAAGELAEFLDAPVGMDPATLATLLREEGWIAGVGRAAAARTAA